MSGSEARMAPQNELRLAISATAMTITGPQSSRPSGRTASRDCELRLTPALTRAERSEGIQSPQGEGRHVQM